MFRTTLSVAHIDGNRWQLLAPLVYEGSSQYFVISPDSRRTSHRSRNLCVGYSTADAVWRESRRPDHPRVDPWHADGLFRRALRETGATALTRGLMWFAVRAAATVSGRFGREGPNFVVKVLQLVGILALGIVTALAPSLVALVGLVVYLVANWIVALVWQIFERSKLHEKPNWPWPLDRKPKVFKAPPIERLIIVDKVSGSSDQPEPLDPLGAFLASRPAPTDAELEAAIGTIAT